MGKFTVAETGSTLWMATLGLDLNFQGWTLGADARIPYFEAFEAPHTQAQTRFAIRLAHSFASKG
ncbi:MAG: hypothetical protein D6765_14000 [Bacteroidetes bacterium]|nr:MAG: hypothetical protein D6765_14000 [Bacteroidota bacterium]